MESQSLQAILRLRSNYIKQGTMPMLSTSFDDEEFHDGQLTAWATACIKYN